MITETIMSREEILKNGFFNERRWLSNFHLCQVEYDGLKYPSSENAYQAAKCLVEKDRLQFVQITPEQARILGKHVQVRPDWEYVKEGVMHNILYAKFDQNRDLYKKLQDTGTEDLVEYNWWGDRYWGVYKGKGENHLGKILMKLRQELKEKDLTN